MPLVKINNRKQVLFDGETEIPTVPVVEDPTSQHWIHTDIQRGEMATNLRSEKVYTRTDFGIVELLTEKSTITGTSDSSCCNIYIGPELIVSSTNTYQNDELIDVDINSIILFVNELRYPLLGDSAKATFDDVTGTITLISGLTFNPNSDIFIIIKPTPTSYVGPEEYNLGTDEYQNDALIDVSEDKVVLFVDELRYPLMGDSAKATFDSPSGTITLISGLTFNPNSDIFILIKP